MLEEFKKYLIELKLSENTYVSYISDVKKYIKYYKDSYDEELTTLKATDIKEYIYYLKNHNCSKPTTINRYLSSLKNYNEFLISKEIQNNLVIAKRDFIKIQPTFVKEDVPEEKRIKQLLHNASEKSRDFCVICLGIYGGLRASEIVNIKISNIHLEERYIEIFGKGNKYRTIVINDILYFAISEYLKERNIIHTNNPYFLVGQKSSNKNHLARNFVNRILDKYNVKNVINNLHPHLLRHFFCTNAYYKAGYTEEQIAAQAGHSNINTTRKYLDNHNKDMLKLANSL